MCESFGESPKDLLAHGAYRETEIRSCKRSGLGAPCGLSSDGSSLSPNSEVPQNSLRGPEIDAPVDIHDDPKVLHQRGDNVEFLTRNFNQIPNCNHIWQDHLTGNWWVWNPDRLRIFLMLDRIHQVLASRREQVASFSIVLVRQCHDVRHASPEAV